jgi:hypothetical protein
MASVAGGVDGAAARAGNEVIVGTPIKIARTTERIERTPENL